MNLLNFSFLESLSASNMVNKFVRELINSGLGKLVLIAAVQSK